MKQTPLPCLVLDTRGRLARRRHALHYPFLAFLARRVRRAFEALPCTAFIISRLGGGCTASTHHQFRLIEVPSICVVANGPLLRRVVTGGVSFSCSFTASSIRFGRVATPSGMTCDARRRACHNQQCVSQANALVPFTLRFGGRVFSHSLFRSRVASLCPLRSLNGGFSLTPGGFISSEATLPRAALSCPAALFPQFLRVGEFVD